MTQGIVTVSKTDLSDARPDHWLSPLPQSERYVFLLRWLALLLVLVLHFFDRSHAGVLFSIPSMALVVAGYNGFFLLLMRYVRWLRRPLNSLALDTVMATSAVYLTGGYHSSFSVLYVFITIGAAFYLALVPTIIVTLGIGLIYVGACYVSPASLQSPYALYILAAKLLLLLVVAVLCALLLEQLRLEQLETERERALASRLRALNELFHQLSTTLDLDLTLQTVAEAPKALLGADLTGIALLDEEGHHLSVVAAAGVDASLGCSPSDLVGQRWSVDNAAVSTLLSTDQPYVVNEPAQYLDTLPPAPTAQRALVTALASIASIVAVPLLLNDQYLGVLGVAFSRPQAFTDGRHTSAWAVSAEDRVFLQALGQEAALAIRNAHLYEREREQVARLRALDELQEGFISAVSHELRTPLTCIKTSVDLLDALSDELSDARGELMHTIAHHLGRLEAFVADLIESTRLQAGRVTLSRQPTDLRLLIDRVVEALRPLMDRKRQMVTVRCPPSLSPVEVDRRRIEQVLTNLLSNAYKFAPRQGQIGVSVTERPDSLQVYVADNGPGITEEDRKHLFDKFYVGSGGRGHSGLGLGLYIARELIELHGGRIWVESQADKGSTFCFAVPKGVQEAQE